MKLPKKKFEFDPNISRASLRSWLLKAIDCIYHEVFDACESAMRTYIEDCGLMPEADNYYLYTVFRCVRGMKREENGVVTYNTIANSLHENNKHATDARPSVIVDHPDIKLYKDNRRGRYANDFYMPVRLDAEVDDIERCYEMWWVVYSPRLRKLVDLYLALNDETESFPTSFVA